MTTLLMSSRQSDDNQALWRAAVRRGWNVVRARGIRVPEIDDPDIVIYMEALIAPAVAERLGRWLLDPPEDWLCRLSPEFRNRDIRLTTLGEARRLDRPVFVKPPNDKSFAARVYNSGAGLPNDFDDDMAVLVADPVQWESEYRCFCLDGRVATLSPYLRAGIPAGQSGYAASIIELNEATRFAEEVAQSKKSTAPRAVVIDVGQISGKGWSVVEANGAWGSGIYGCDPDAVLDVVQQATL